MNSLIQTSSGKEIIAIYAISVIVALFVATSYGLFPIDLNADNGMVKTFIISSVFIIPFIITALLSADMRKKDKFTSYMQAWIDISIFWALFLGLSQTVIIKSPHFFTF
jgi:hypothetical protein